MFKQFDFLSLKVFEFWQKLGASILRWKWAWVFSILAVLAFGHWFSFGVNASTSLPNSLYFIFKKDHTFSRGDYVSFRWHGGGPYKSGIGFTKIIKGMPGDTVKIVDRNIYINGEYISTAKPRAKTGQLLEIGPEGIIPAGYFYVHGSSEDSLDSRYAITGWIKSEKIIGKAKPIF